MNGEGCWSTVVCTPTERAALGLTGQSEWLLHCRLGAGHRGNHATDASSHPRTDRRLWLEWNDFDDHAQSLIERNPCSFRSPHGAGCLYFEGHGGAHFFAPSNGHAPVAAGRPESTTGQAPSPGQSSPMSRPIPRPATPTTHRPAAPGHRADTDVPAIRPSATTATQESSPASPQTGPTQTPRIGARPAGPPAGAQAGAGRHDSYRLGRRSTGAEPPTNTAARTSRRHRLPDSGVGDTASRSPAPPGAAVPIPGRPAAAPVGAPVRDRYGTDVAAALRDVAAALEKLAAAMRQPPNH